VGNSEDSRYFGANASSVLLRPLRQLLKERNPPGDVTMLLFGQGEKLTNPFGALYTGHDRVCFWPTYPKGTDMTTAQDHLTLDVQSGKSHWTRFDANGKKHQIKGTGTSWKLHKFPDSTLAWWFQLVLRWDVLADQPMKVSAEGEAPSQAAGEVITEQLHKYAEGIASPIVVPLPTTQLTEPSCVLLQAFISSDPAHKSAFRPDMYITSYAADKLVGADASAEFPIRAIDVSRGSYKFYFAVGCPRAASTVDVSVGMPKKEVA
jgi:hypothetical protein